MKRIIVDDGNGGQVAGHLIESKIKRWHVVLGVVATALTIIAIVGGVTFNATKFGVTHEVQDHIRMETVDDNGVIHREMEREILEHEMQSERQLNRKLNNIQNGITRIETKQQSMCDRLDRLEDD